MSLVAYPPTIKVPTEVKDWRKNFKKQMLFELEILF